MPITHCYHCDSAQTVRHGYTTSGKQRYRCRSCGRSFVSCHPGTEVARVAIVDDHELLRRSIISALSGERDFRVVGEAADGREALRLCHHVRPEIVLMDVQMPFMNGLEATRAIKQQFPYIAVLVLTAHEDRDYVLESLRSGAAGYVLKSSPHSELVTALRKVVEGETVINRELATDLLRKMANEAQGAVKALPEPEWRRTERSPQRLTPRELEVLERVALGETNREIAQGLGISVSTVKRHLESTVFKLEVSDRIQAVVRALDLGVISFPEKQIP